MASARPSAWCAAARCRCARTRPAAHSSARRTCPRAHTYKLSSYGRNKTRLDGAATWTRSRRRSRSRSTRRRGARLQTQQRVGWGRRGGLFGGQGWCRGGPRPGGRWCGVEPAVSGRLAATGRPAVGSRTCMGAISCVCLPVKNETVVYNHHSAPPQYFSTIFGGI